MGCGASAIYPSATWSIHPRNAFVGPNDELIKDAPAIQEFSNVAISHAQLASNRNRTKRDRDVEIQRRDLLWDKKLHLFANLNDLKPYDERAFKVPAHTDRDSNRLVQYLVQGLKEPAHKARALAMWIASHIKYDNTLDSNNHKNSEIATVFQTRRSLCGGFCRLYELFCNIAGIKCKYISGLARSGSFDPTVKFNVDFATGRLLGSDVHEHAWTILLIDNQWHMVDLTWTAGTIGDGNNGGNQDFQFKWQEEWFFCEPYSFVFTHFPYKNRAPAISRQNISKPMSFDNWADSALFTTTFFDYGLRAVSHTCLWIETDKFNCAEIHFNITHDMNFYSKLSKDGKSYGDFCCISAKNNLVTVQILLPSAGKFKFELWASLVFAEENLKDVKLLCVYGIVGTNKNHSNRPLPKGAWPYWGPTYVMDYLGLQPISHNEPKVKLVNGEAELIFKTKNSRRSTFNLMFSFHKENDLDSLKNQFTAWKKDKFIYLKLFVKEPGKYRLTILSKSKSRSEWSQAANYLIEASENDFSSNNKLYHFPQWPHLLGLTDQFYRLGMDTIHQTGFIQLVDGKFELQLYLEKPVNIEHKLYSVDKPDEESLELSRCVYACIDNTSKWVTYSIRFPQPGWYFFRLISDVYQYDEATTKRPWLANYLFENEQGFDGGLFPDHESLWGLTASGVEFGLQMPANTSSTIKSKNGVATLVVECDDNRNDIDVSLENGKGDTLSQNFVTKQYDQNLFSVTVTNVKVGYYKLSLYASDKIDDLLGVFLIVIT